MHLRVLTLNVWGLPLGIARHTPARMRAIAQRLDALDADVVAFQEVWTQESRTLLSEAAQASGYTTVWHRRPAFGGSGLMLLSRLPSLGTRFTPYRLGGLPQRPQHADYYGRKGFVQLELETPEGPVALIDTHLHAGYNAPDQHDEYLGIRAAQAIQIAIAVRDIRNPVVAVGDFNTEEHEAAYQILLGLSGLEDAATALDQRQPTVLRGNPYRGATAGEARIDLVLSRRGENRSLKPISIQRVLDEELVIEGKPASYSDHAGVLADFELQPAREPTSLPRPVDLSALAVARDQIALGLEITGRRHTREARYAGAGLAVSGLLGAGACGARRSRRELVVRLATAVAGMGVLGASGAYLGSRWIASDETAGYREIAADLERLQPTAAPRNKRPAE